MEASLSAGSFVVLLTNLSCISCSISGLFQLSCTVLFVLLSYICVRYRVSGQFSRSYYYCVCVSDLDLSIHSADQLTTFSGEQIQLGTGSTSPGHPAYSAATCHHQYQQNSDLQGWKKKIKSV